MSTMSRFFPAFFVVAVCIGLFGCAPRQQGATPQSFYASGRANFSISVAPPMVLAATGSLSATVPSDVTMPPTGTFRYAVFGEEGTGPVQRHAHMILSELPQDEWRFEMETWAPPEGMSYAKTRLAGKYWTVQMLPVFAARDWFSDLWLQNGREAPEFWLAKRWSATPEKYMRVVAEYREPAPLCMRKRLSEVSLDDRNAPPVRGKGLWRNCEREIEEFSARADTAFNFERAADLPERGVRTSAAQPATRPNMGKLVGRAERNDWDTLRTGD